jgi:hypothetical protein
VEIILITETNFILDIAFEQSEQAERLLALIQQQNIFLVIPEYVRLCLSSLASLNRPLPRRRVTLRTRFKGEMLL